MSQHFSELQIDDTKYSDFKFFFLDQKIARTLHTAELSFASLLYCGNLSSPLQILIWRVRGERDCESDDMIQSQTC